MMVRHEDYMKQAAKADMVNHPPHYNQGGIECIDYIRQVLGPKGFIDYCHGQLIKYQHRYKYKGKAIEDMDKADWYMQRMRETLIEIDDVKS